MKILIALVTEDRLRTHLANYQWDVNRTAAAIGQVEQIAQNARQPCPPTIEQSRLHVLHDMHTALGATAINRQTSNAVLALLYSNRNWVSEDALTEIVQSQGDDDDLFEYLPSHRPQPEVDVERDERLARSIDVTSTNSHYSALQFLIQHEWDLAMALDSWLSEGGLPIVYPPLPRRQNQARESGLRDTKANRPQRVVHGSIERAYLEQDAFDTQRPLRPSLLCGLH